MSSPAPSARRMTVAEFLDWNPPGDERWELVDGRPVMMAPAASTHSIIVGNLAGEVRTALRSRPNCTLRVAPGVRRRNDEYTLRVPDLAVSCREHRRGERITEEPLILIEVLSPSTEGEDQRIKLPEYRAQDSVMEIVLVSSRAALIEIHRRIEGGLWLTELAFGRDGVIQLASIDARIPLAEIYRGVDLADEPEKEPTPPAP